LTPVGCSLEEKARMAQKAGAVAVLIDSYFYGPITDPTQTNDRDAEGTRIHGNNFRG
jgi:hypothetical protein